MATETTSIEQLSINTIRTLAMDAVQAANSGHPGTPMALAPVAYSLWNEALKYDPAHPLCIQRVDSEGKVTDKLALPLDQLKNFRQWQSLTPGHPESELTTGVETTTGPLGQGCGNSVGMAIAQRWLAARYNRPNYKLCDYNVYALCSDGDLMEGIGCEAASLAGHLQLSNLCWIYDDNRITIEGDTDLAFSENVGRRFEGLGWHVVKVDDANDINALTRAYSQFKSTEDRPTLIIVRSHIGYGSPNKQGSHEAHGAPLGEEEVRATKSAYGWPEDAKFLVPDDVPQHFADNLGARGAKAYDQWHQMFDSYKKEHPELAEQLEMIDFGQLPNGWDADIPEFPADEKGTATRGAGGKVLNAIAKHVPWMIGGSADLAPSTKTILTFDGAGHFQADNQAGRNFHFGVREHAMAAAVNGMCLSGIRAYGATFFVFSDYLRPSMRLAALMGIPSIFVFTHDSIGVGEDGPTHQPVEHLAACRSIPKLVVLRPGDANETAEAWRAIMNLAHRPAALVLTRQNLPTLDRSVYAPASGVSRGGYVLADADDGKPQVILMATGSELQLAVAARETLADEGIAARVVSMPSWELFDEQDEAYRNEVLPPKVTARVAVEAGVVQGWERYLGSRGIFVGMDSFGASAPYKEAYEGFGITAEAVADAARSFGT